MFRSFYLFFIIEEIVFLLWISFLMYFAVVYIWPIFGESIWLTINFPLIDGLTLFQRYIFFWILTVILSQSLISTVELLKFVAIVLLETWDHIIFHCSPVLFSYAPAHNGRLFENSIFELETLSYSFRMGLSLENQLISPEEMVTSLAKFINLSFWYFSSMLLSMKWGRTLVNWNYSKFFIKCVGDIYPISTVWIFLVFQQFNYC